MLPTFQRAWWEAQFRQPNWYERLEDVLRRFLLTVVHDDPQIKAWRHQVYTLLGELLAHDEVPLAATGPNLDEARQGPDTLVIHHTEEDPEIALSTLSAIGLLRQYGFQYLEDNVLGHPVRGQPVWSGHFRDGRMVFFAYHWLVRPDGTCERLLDDQAIGWHAGNWEINTRSIGLAFSGNYEHSSPPQEQLAAATRLIQTYYPAISPQRVLGHCEIRSDLTCPGDRFLADWKARLCTQLS